MDKVVLGLTAEKLMNDEAFKAALVTVESAYTEIWKSSGPKEAAEREAAYTSIRVLADIKGQLASFIDHGNYLKIEREAEKSVNRNKPRGI